MSKDFQWYLTRDNFLSELECQEIIDIVDSGRITQNQHKL